MSEKRPKDNLTTRLVREATRICENGKNGIVKPYHLLLAIVQDPDAGIFLENLDFDFGRLKRAIDFAQIELDTYPHMDDEQAAVISTDVMGIIQSAERFSNHQDRPWAGYAEILFCLKNMGDDDTVYILDRVMDMDDDALDKLLLHELSEWTPHMKIVPKTSREFNKASNDNKKSRRQAIMHLADNIKKVVFDQDEPVDQICDALKLGEAGMKEEDSTLGNFLLNGPTGVGKTEICKQIAGHLDMEFVRLDMSEYMERHTVSRLIGAPPGYVGHDSAGLLTGPIIKANEENRPVLLLLDEMEKAHPRIYDILLPVMDAARLTDTKGNVADFKNVLLVMTSNIGEHEASLQDDKEPIGFGRSKEQYNSASKGDIQDNAVRETFTPEFRNRLDGVFRLNPLSAETVKKIARKFINEMHDLPASKKFNLGFDVSESALAKFVEDGHDPKMGARPMKRLIKKEFRQKVAELILTEGVSNEHIVIDYDPAEGKYRLDRNPENGVLLLGYEKDVEEASNDRSGEEPSGNLPDAPRIIAEHF